MAKAEPGDGMAGTAGRLARALIAAAPPSPASLRQAKLLLLDTIGCGVLGSRDALATVTFGASVESAGACALIGRRKRLTPAAAAFVNGVAIRVADMNDYLVTTLNGEPETGGHPSDNIPVALAIGSTCKSKGGDILAAIAMAYELYARLQAMIDRTGPWDGATVSGLVAPAIAGRLMGLDETRLAHALALGLSRAATPAIVRRGHISATKSISNALVAQSGVQAAQLAAAGISGPLSILDDSYGLGHIFARPDMDSLTAPLPESGAILRAQIKAYPCVNTGQSAVAAALALRGMLRSGAESLEEIEIAMADYPVVKRQQADDARMNPKTRESADHSFPFAVAVSLLDGAFGLRQYDNERWRDPKVLALTGKMRLRTARFDANTMAAPFPCTIRARDRSGQVYAAGPVDPPGAAKNGLDETAVIAKFEANTKDILSRGATERIVEACLAFDRAASSEDVDAAIATEEIRA